VTLDTVFVRNGGRAPDVFIVADVKKDINVIRYEEPVDAFGIERFGLSTPGVKILQLPINSNVLYPSSASPLPSGKCNNAHGCVLCSKETAAAAAAAAAATF